MIIINEIRKIPFFRLIIPFVLGILYQINSPIARLHLLALVIPIIVFTIFFGYFYNKNPNYHKRWTVGFLVSFSLFFSGSLTTAIQTRHIIFTDEGVFTARLIEPVKETKKNIKAIVELMVYQTDSVKKPAKQKVVLHIQKDSLSATLKYGDLITFISKLKEINNSGNPEEFDYKSYLASKNIYQQAYVDTSNWELLSRYNGNMLYATAYNLRAKLLGIYQSNNIKGNEFAILAALTLGVKDYLSPQIIKDYSASGAMHILAVSGLHIGIIYLILYNMLFFMRKNKILRFLQSVILLLFIWLFAFITGLSSSVTRASIMLSFIIIGKASGRHPSVYNSIAISAFLILIIKPLAILQVGFQLSYAAVLSIVYFQPKLYRLLNPNNIILDKAWALTAVSIAAQIGTMPISLYYFHKFPVYFFITNLIAIPAAYFIIFFAIALLLFNSSAFFSGIFAFLLNTTISGLNWSLALIEEFPFSSITHISLSSLESFMLYLFIVFVGVFFLNKSKSHIVLALGSLLLFFVLKNNRAIQAMKKSEFIVFNSKLVPVIGIKQGHNLAIITDSTFSKNKKNTTYLLDNLLTNNFIKDTTILRSDILDANDTITDGYFYKNHFIEFKNFRAVLINNELFNNKKNTSKLKTDILILSKGFSTDIQNLKELFDFKLLVLDATIPYWQEKTILRDCAALNISTYNVKESGAFIKKRQ